MKNRKSTTTKKKSRSNPEKEIQKSMLELLSLLKIPHARINSGSIFTGKYKVKLAPEGFPDMLVFYKGACHAVEVKRPGEDLRPPQVWWRQVLLENGVRHLVAESVDDLLEYLKGIGHE